MNTMNRRIFLYIICGLAAIGSTVSCDFLKEDPKTFLSPENYFTSENQIQAAVNGLYGYTDDIFDGDIEVGTNVFIFLDYLSGYGDRLRTASGLHLDQSRHLSITDDNTIIEKMWRSWYTAIENCNYTIVGIEASSAEIEASKKSKLLGEAYFLRAWYYYYLVRLWGPVPLKLAPTTDLSNVEIPLSSEEQVYGAIVADLVQAEKLMAEAAMKGTDGHVALGAVKSLLADVYLTMAGYPLQKGSEYYSLAYEKAKEVKGEFALEATYDAMRANTNTNSGEYIFSIQREPDLAGSPVHNAMLPYPEVLGISQNSAYGGAMAPTIQFYNSYDEGDKRVENQGYYYTEKNGVAIGQNPCIYKWWDQNAADTGKSGVNYPLIRYADVLLCLAEAKAMADGGTTSDSEAIDAYYQVRSRAMPDESRPASLTFEQVYKETTWEMCFETQTWFDILRTRKVMDTRNGNIVNMIGATTPGHGEAAFGEEDLLFPYPRREVRLNPNLKR